jgi:nicotinamide mononucleotide transporter
MPSYQEIFGVVTAILYLVLAMFRRRSCWIVSFVSSLAFFPVFLASRLYMDAALQLYFGVMAVDGYRRWGGDASVSPVQLPSSRHLVGSGAVIVTTVVVGALLSRFTDAAQPFADSFVATGSVWATYLTTRMVRENWLYWIVINVVAVWVFAHQGLYGTSFLMALYGVLAFVGYVQWRR